MISTTETAKDWKLTGHWFYCRRCVTPEGIIKLPDYYRDASLVSRDATGDPSMCVYEVLAIGPEVGKPRKMDVRMRKVMGIPKCLGRDVKIGDKILLPNRHPWGIKDGFNACDAFIDESIPEAVVE